MDNEPRFYSIDWDDDDHLADLLRAFKAGDLVPVVDDEAGGIICYALGTVSAEHIVAVLS